MTSRVRFIVLDSCSSSVEQAICLHTTDEPRRRRFKNRRVTAAARKHTTQEHTTQPALHEMMGQETQCVSASEERCEKRLYESILSEKPATPPAKRNRMVGRAAAMVAEPIVQAEAELSGFQKQDLEGRPVPDVGATMCIDVSQGEGKHSDWYRANDRWFASPADTIP